MNFDEYDVPKHLNICGRKIKIKVVENLVIEGIGKANGCYQHDLNLITLDSLDGMDTATLLHEAVHAVMTSSGLADVVGLAVEEAICRAMEMLAPAINFKGKR